MIGNLIILLNIVYILEWNWLIGLLLINFYMILKMI